MAMLVVKRCLLSCREVSFGVHVSRRLLWCKEVSFDLACCCALYIRRHIRRHMRRHIPDKGRPR